MTAITLLLIVGQASASQAEQFIDVQHDTHRGVTCWIVNGTGISCLPARLATERQAQPDISHRP